jgi:hypothetical protein
MLQNRDMKTFATLSALALLASAPLQPAQAQGSWPPPAASPAMRNVVSYQISAALLSRRLPGDWADAIPDPLLAEMEADTHFASIDIGSELGNGILIRFDFDDMESYHEWNDSPAVQQMLAEIGQAIGYGYSRSSLSMRRVASDTRSEPAPRRAPASPPAAQPVKPAPPKVTTRAASQSS